MREGHASIYELLTSLRLDGIDVTDQELMNANTGYTTDELAQLGQEIAQYESDLKSGIRAEGRVTESLSYRELIEEFGQVVDAIRHYRENLSASVN